MKHIYFNIPARNFHLSIQTLSCFGMFKMGKLFKNQYKQKISNSFSETIILKVTNAS